MKRALRLLGFVFCALTSCSTWALTAWQENRLLVLQKITVGPWDNFAASVSADDAQIYFTRDRTQISNIYRRTLATDRVESFMAEHGDAKNPVLQAHGKMLGFVSFAHDAQGDVCIVTLTDQSTFCISDSSSVDTAPFWINAGMLGYLRRLSGQAHVQLVAYDLQTKTTRVLRRGRLSAPTASPDGRYILFTATTTDGKASVQVFDRQSATSKLAPSFDLSGITGLLAFSRDGRTVYFNQYMSDTNGDQVIDGNDHSVAFRIPFAKWLGATEALLPEQLTSVANDCALPSLSQQFLYLSCAFEGSLDVYRIARSGAVPKDWSRQQIEEAHHAARSYETRILLLNTLRYRFGLDGVTILERLLSNHLEIGELTAAMYFVRQLSARYQKMHKPNKVTFYRALGDLLWVRSSKQRVPVGVVTAQFESVVAQRRQKIRASSAWPRLRAVMEGYLDDELERPQEALAALAKVDLAESMPAMERYLAFELYRRVLSENNPQRLLRSYPFMFNAVNLPAEAKIYYAFHYLKLLGGQQADIKLRSQQVQAQGAATTDAKIKSLFMAEAISLDLAFMQDKKQQRQAFARLSQLLKDHQTDLLLRKALHTRAIQILGAAEQFKYMELLSRHWLTTTHMSEMEFYNTAEQYAIITMDKAYGKMALGEWADAYNAFYSAIRQTSDLEAYYQFVSLGLDPRLNKRRGLDKSLLILREQNILANDAIYVNVLRQLIAIETQQPAAKPSDYAKLLRQADRDLQTMPRRAVNPAMRDLLLGYVNHKLLRLLRQGYGYDKALFQKVHRHYMMALDLGRKNSRIEATVWLNLAGLHFEVRNYALAASFFRRRLRLPFVSQQNEADARWAFARALFYSHNLQAALQQAQTALALATTNGQIAVTPFVEKAAFYALQAGQYALAERYYQTLDAQYLNNKTVRPNPYNRVKLLLARSYTLIKLKENQKAQQLLRQVVNLCQDLAPQAKDRTHLLAFKPQRQQLIAYGLLAKLADHPQARIDLRRQRISILQQMLGKTAAFGYQESRRLSLLSKDWQHIAVAYEMLGDTRQMFGAINQALVGAQSWSKETGIANGPVIYRTLLNYLSLGLSYPKVFATRPAKKLLQSSQKTIAAMATDSYRSATIVVQQAKLSILLQAYRSRVLRQEVGGLKQRLDDLLAVREIKALQTLVPQQYAQLKGLAGVLSQE